MFSTNIREEKPFAAEQRIRYFKKLFLKRKSRRKASSNKKNRC